MASSLKCDVCNKEFSSKSSLSTHKKKAKFCILKQENESKDELKLDTSNSNVSVSNASNENLFINELKNSYESRMRDKDERITILESLLEKMELKLEKYQNTIMAIALNSLSASYTTTNTTYSQRCENPTCMKCRTESDDEKDDKNVQNNENNE